MRYFLGLLAVVAFIILVVVIVMHGGSKTTTPKTANGAKTVVLTDYIAKNSEVHLYMDGQINAIEDHRAIEIVVTPTTRTLTVYKGYDLSVLRRQTYTNDQPAYDNLLHALSLAGFVKEKTGVRQTDERGVCPSGDRFIYELREDGKDVTRLWTTTCGTGLGTYGGVNFRTRDLFQKQIPDYLKLTQGILL